MRLRSQADHLKRGSVFKITDDQDVDHKREFLVYGINDLELMVAPLRRGGTRGGMYPHELPAWEKVCDIPVKQMLDAGRELNDVLDFLGQNTTNVRDAHLYEFTPRSFDGKILIYRAGVALSGAKKGLMNANFILAQDGSAQVRMEYFNPDYFSMPSTCFDDEDFLISDSCNAYPSLASAIERMDAAMDLLVDDVHFEYREPVYLG